MQTHPAVLVPAFLASSEKSQLPLSFWGLVSSITRLSNTRDYPPLRDYCLGPIPCPFEVNKGAWGRQNQPYTEQK